MGRVLILAAAVLLGGCATGYHRVGFSGGFSETQLAEDVFQVSFNGNGYTSGQRAADFALLRSAEVIAAHGFTHFAIVDAKSAISQSSYTTPTTTTGSATRIGNSVYGSTTTTGGQTYVFQKPSSHNTVIGFRTKPEGFSYDAAFVIKSLRSKYKLTTK